MRIQLRLSTMTVIAALVAPLVGFWLSRFSGDPNTIARWVVFALWPLAACAALILSAFGIARRQGAQPVGEALLAAASLVIFFWTVSQPN